MVFQLVLHSSREQINAKIQFLSFLRIFHASKISAYMVVVQPTGAGKSVCYIVPALLNSSKVTLVIEPVVAVITE